MNFFSRSKAPGANGSNNKPFSQAELNKASQNLQSALSKIANQHVRRYANEIKNAAIAKARNGYVPQVNLNRMKAAEAAAKAAVKPVPTATIETQTVNATNALMRRINAITNANNMNNITNSNNFKGLSANNQGKVRNYSRAKFPIKSGVSVIGTRGTTISLVKNSPTTQWRFRKANANKGYVLTNANKNTPKVYFSANLVPKNS